MKVVVRIQNGIGGWWTDVYKYKGDKELREAIRNEIKMLNERGEDIEDDLDEYETIDSYFFMTREYGISYDVEEIKEDM